MGDLPRIFSSNEQLGRGHSFTVPDTVSRSSEAMAVAGYGLRLTTYGRLSTTPDDEARNLATPQTRREAFREAHSHRIHRILGRIVEICLALAFAVAMAVWNLQIINHPAHPEMVLWARPHTWGLGLVCLDPGHHPPTPWCPWHGILYPALGKVKESHYGNDEPLWIPLDFPCALGAVVWPRRGAAHWGAAARGDWRYLGHPRRSPSVDVSEAASSWVEEGGSMFFADVDLLVCASHVACHAEIWRMGFVDRGGSCEMVISDPCHGVAGMGLVGGGRGSIQISRDSEELGRASWSRGLLSSMCCSF